MMTRPPLLERSLAVVAPRVAAQLHPTRNGLTTARAVPAGSEARVWWLCPAGHEWQALVRLCTRGSGCPYYAGRLPTADTCLAARDPVLAGQWHLTRDGTLTPADVVASARRRVCGSARPGTKWQAQVRDRTAGGTGCPRCPRPAARTLLVGHPRLAEQWDTTANGELTDAVTSGSRRRV